jgi:hypothetical protein
LTGLGLGHKLNLGGTAVAVDTVQSGELAELALIRHRDGHEPRRSILTDGAPWYENAVICHYLIGV